MSLYLCVDCGGTKTSAVICNSSGIIVGRAPAGPSNITYLTPDAFISAVREAVGNALKTAISPLSETPISLPFSGPTPFAGAWFGISGADSPAAIAKISSPLSALLGLPLGPKLIIANDAHLLAAPLRMHTDVDCAVAAVSGTGSITIGFRKVNETIKELGRIGGWGWVLGDEGSGFFVGREGLRELLMENDKASVNGVSPPPSIFRDLILQKFGVADVMEILTKVYPSDSSTTTPREKQISSLSPLVFEAAFQHNDPLALNVLQRSAKQLGSQIAVLLGEGIDVTSERSIKAQNSVISFGGSLVGVEKYRQMIVDDLAQRGHVFKHVVFVDDAAAIGAVGLAASFNR